MTNVLVLPKDGVIRASEHPFKMPDRLVKREFRESAIIMPRENLLVLPHGANPDRDLIRIPDPHDPRGGFQTVTPFPTVVHMPISDAFDDFFDMRRAAENMTRAQKQRVASLPGAAKLKFFMGIVNEQRQADSKRPINPNSFRAVRGGAAGTWTFTDVSKKNMFDGTFDLDTDTFKTALLLSTSNISSSTTTHAGVTNEHSNANGYTTGGISTTLTVTGTGTVTVDISSDPVWTASGGSIVARFAEIYEVSGNTWVYALLDSTPANVTATDGNTLTVAAHSSGVITAA